MRAVRMPFSEGRPSRLKKLPGILPGGVHALLDVHGEGQEVHVARVAGGGGAEHHGVAGANYDRAACLLGVLPGLEADLGAGDIDRHAVN